MSFAHSFLAEFEQEMEGTGSIVKLVPQSLLTWKAHESLRTIGWVASHIVDTLSWTEVIVKEPSFDISPPGEPPHDTPLIESVEQIGQQFEANFASTKELVSSAEDAAFAEPWTLLQNEKTLFTAPRGQVLKNFLINHVIHHRAFLIAYLRMNNVECPGLYG